MCRTVFVALAAFLVSLLCGCAPTRPLSAPATSLEDVNNALTGETARLYLSGSTDPQRVEAVTVTTDSVYYRELQMFTARTRDEPEARQSAIAAVDSIAVEYGAGGGTAGFLVGATPGIMLSGISLLSLTDSDCTSWCEGFAEAFLGLGVAGILVGGGIGTLVGNAIDEDAQVVYRRPVDRYLAPTPSP